MCLTTIKPVKLAKHSKADIIKIFKRDTHNNVLLGLIHDLNPIHVKTQNKSSDTVLYSSNGTKYPSGYHGYANTKSVYAKCVAELIRNPKYNQMYEIWYCQLSDVHTVGLETHNILNGRVTVYVGKHMKPIRRLVAYHPDVREVRNISKCKVFDLTANKYVKPAQMTRRREYEVRAWGAK